MGPVIYCLACPALCCLVLTASNEPESMVMILSNSRRLPSALLSLPTLFVLLAVLILVRGVTALPCCKLHGNKESLPCVPVFGPHSGAASKTFGYMKT